jgi:hypothetical protein
MTWRSLSVACVLLAACGTDSSIRAGDFLISTTLMGSRDGEPFAPIYGFARDAETSGTFEAVGQLIVATDPIDCNETFTGEPRAGTYVAVALMSYEEGNYRQVFFDFIHVSADLSTSGGNSADGRVRITASAPEQLTATLRYRGTLDGETYDLSGDMTALRCR